MTTPYDYHHEPRVRGEWIEAKDGKEDKEDERGREAEGRKLVVVLDDDPRLTEYLSSVIREELHWDVVSFNEAEGAFEFVELTLPDIIVLDVIMPGISGMEFYDKLKAHSKARWVPILFISATSDMSALNVPNMISFLRKPFTIEEFQSAVTNLVAR